MQHDHCNRRPGSGGQGTLARRLAMHLNLAYLDTGLIYRAVAKRVLIAGADPEDAVAAEAEARAMQPVALQLEGLRTDEVAQAASVVSAVPGVRAALLEFQRDFAISPPDGKAGAVLDGRDIGTVVCPEATLKLLLRHPQRYVREGALRSCRTGALKLYARVLRI